MPRIGRIDVPDTLWKALIDGAADDFCQIAFDIAERKLGPDSIKDLPQLIPEDSEAIEKRGSHIQDCIIALIRMKTEDFLSDHETIMRGEDYRKIEAAAQLQGDQIAYRVLSSDKQLAAIKNILDSNWPGGSTSLPPPL